MIDCLSVPDSLTSLISYLLQSIVILHYPSSLSDDVMNRQVDYQFQLGLPLNQ